MWSIHDKTTEKLLEIHRSCWIVYVSDHVSIQTRFAVSHIIHNGSLLCRNAPDQVGPGLYLRSDDLMSTSMLKVFFQNIGTAEAAGPPKFPGAFETLDKRVSPCFAISNILYDMV
jgi:hypothetical protein